MSSAQQVAAKRGVRPPALPHSNTWQEEEEEEEATAAPLPQILDGLWQEEEEATAPLPQILDELWQEEEEEEEEAAAAPLPQILDGLWHYDCVVRPLPARTSPLHSPVSPHSPATAFSPHPASTAFDVEKGRHFQRHVLHRVFSTFDENQDGWVCTQEIISIFQRLGIPQNEDSIESLLARLITKREGHVNEQEFYLLYDSVCSTDSSSSSVNDDVEQKDLLAAFHVFDKDGNGFISPSELQSVLCSLGFLEARQLDACVDMIARVDENGDGQVDFFEFKKLFHLENASLLVSSF